MKILYWFIHHLIRPVWSIIFNIPVSIWLLAWYLFDETTREIYSENKSLWGEIDSLEKLRVFYDANYKYNYEGFFDRDNFSLEWFIRWGDCDDMARWGVKKLRALGYKATRIFMWGKGQGIIEKIKNQHYAIIVEKDSDLWVLNYDMFRHITSIRAGAKAIDQEYSDAIRCIW